MHHACVSVMRTTTFFYFSKLCGAKKFRVCIMVLHDMFRYRVFAELGRLHFFR